MEIRTAPYSLTGSVWFPAQEPKIRAVSDGFTIALLEKGWSGKAHQAEGDGVAFVVEPGVGFVTRVI